MKIRLLRNLMIGGKFSPATSEIEVGSQLGKELIARGVAVNVIDGDTDGDGKLDADERKAKRAKKTETEPAETN